MKNIFRLAMAAGGICLAMCTFGCSKKAKVTTVVPKNPGLILPKSATARDDFIRGVDVSTVIALEKAAWFSATLTEKKKIFLKSCATTA